MILDPAGPPLKAAASTSDKIDSRKDTIPEERSSKRADARGKWDAVRLGLQVKRCRLPEMGKDRGTCSLQNCVSKHLCC